MTSKTQVKRPCVFTPDDAFMVIGAFRYALGRHSYAPGLVADWIWNRRDDLPAESLTQIAREIREAHARDGGTIGASMMSSGELGYGHNAQRWLTLADSLEGFLGRQRG